MSCVSTLRLPCLSFLGCVLAARAFAAPVLVHATPAAGQHVPAGNVAIRLGYNSVIDPFRARLLLLGPSGVPQLLAASPSDDEQQGLATTVALTPGHYVLHWRMRAPGGTPAEGNVPFDVDPAGPAGAVAPAGGK